MAKDITALLNQDIKFEKGKISSIRFNQEWFNIVNIEETDGRNFISYRLGSKKKVQDIVVTLDKKGQRYYAAIKIYRHALSKDLDKLSLLGSLYNNPLDAALQLIES
jgi:hypothetical protein